MLLTLLCAQPHPLTPALVVGNEIVLERLADGRTRVTLPGTSQLLHHVAQAIRDRALVLVGGDGPLLEEIATMVEADRDRLLAKADAVMASHPSHRAAS